MMISRKEGENKNKTEAQKKTNRQTNRQAARQQENQQQQQYDRDKLRMNKLWSVFSRLWLGSFQSEHCEENL